MLFFWQPIVFNKPGASALRDASRLRDALGPVNFAEVYARIQS